MIIVYHFSSPRSSTTSKLVPLISSPVSQIPEDKTPSLSTRLKVDCDFTVKTPSVYVKFFFPDVAQSDLETVIPKAQDAHVRVVRGPHRGQVRTIFLFICLAFLLTTKQKYDYTFFCAALKSHTCLIQARLRRLHKVSYGAQRTSFTTTGTWLEFVLGLVWDTLCDAYTTTLSCNVM